MLSCEIKLHRVMRFVRRVITLLAPVVRTNHVKSGDECDVERSAGVVAYLGLKTVENFKPLALKVVAIACDR